MSEPSPTAHGIDRTTEGSEGQYLVATCSCGWNRSSVTSRGLTSSINAHRRAVTKQRQLTDEARTAVEAAGGTYQAENV